MTLGLANSPLYRAIVPICFVFLDYIIVANPTFDLHLKSLKEVFHGLKTADTTVNLDKCVLPSFIEILKFRPSVYEPIVIRFQLS